MEINGVHKSSQMTPTHFLYISQGLPSVDFPSFDDFQTKFISIVSY